MQGLWSQRWTKLLACSGFVAVAVGLAAHQMWRVVPWERFALSLLLALASMVLAWPLARTARLRMATALLVVWLGAAIFFIGIAPVLAVALLGTAAKCLGTRLRLGAPDQPMSPAITTAIGLVLIGGVAGWTLLWPIHTTWLWALLLLAILAVHRARIAEASRAAASAWQAAVAEAPRWSASSVVLLGLASTACWLPTLQADDLAYHLALPSQLLAHGGYRPVAQHQVWAFAPWLGDVLHGIGFVLARQDARGALNLLWLAIAASAAWTLASGLSADTRQRWMCVALLASFPPMVWMAAGMQTELPALSLLLVLAILLQSRMHGRFVSLSVLFGGLLALKLIHVFAALPLLAYALWQARADVSWRRTGAAVALVVAVAGSSYFYAWWHTGNPVFPLFNTVFASPDYPLRDFDDARWHAGFLPWLPWLVVFETTRYFEAWNGATGFALIALAGGTALAIRDRPSRALAIAASAALALALLPMQYARYAFPMMALLMVVSLPAFHDALAKRTATMLVVALCVLNLAFQANASWLHHSAALKRLIRSGGDATPLSLHYAPERLLLQRIPESCNEGVLATDPSRNVVAELAGCGRTVSGHDPVLEALRIDADLDPGGQAWQSLITSSDASWLLVTPATASKGLRNSLALADARLVQRTGDAELWRLPGRKKAKP